MARSKVTKLESLGRHSRGGESDGRRDNVFLSSLFGSDVV